MIYQSRLFRCFVAVVALLLLFPVAYGAKQAWDQQTNRVEDWLPETFEETQQLLWFLERFGSDELLMISWDGCTLEDARLAELTARLQEPVDVHGQPVQWFERVWSGKEILRLLTEEPIGLTEAQALDRMQGWLVGPDRETTCVIATVSRFGMGDRAGAVEFVLATAESVTGLPRESLALAGPTYDGVAINEASKNSLLQLNLWSFLVCLIILYGSLKSYRLTMIVFLSALFAQQSSMAVMYYTGVPMDSILLLVANLTFVLTVACGIHLINYYIDAVMNEQSQPVQSAIRSAIWPTLMSNFTTALGMISLLVSQILPVRNFGLYAAIATGIVCLVLLTLIPVLLLQFSLEDVVRKRHQVSAERWSRSVWGGLSQAVMKFRWGLMAIFAILIGYGLTGASRLDASARLADLFSEEAKVIRDYQWLESHVSALVPVEIVLEFPHDTTDQLSKTEAAVQFLRRMQWTDQLRDQLQQLPGVGGSLTTIDFTPPEGEEIGTRRLARHRIWMQRIYDQRQGLTDIGYWKPWQETELWRISLRVSSGREWDYGELLTDIHERIDAQAAVWEIDRPLQVAVCGGVPLVYKAQNQLLNDLGSSFALALVMIAVTLMILAGGIRTGLMTLAPNLIPALLVFGTMGWQGKVVEIGSILTATVALGITVDDTLHYLTWYRKGRQSGLSGSALLFYCYQHCGTAMIQTSLVCSFGLLVFSFSPFMPISRFAWLMFSLMLLGLMAAIIFLPGLLSLGERTKTGKSA